LRKVVPFLVVITLVAVFIANSSLSAQAKTVKYDRTVSVGLSVNCSQLPKSGKVLRVLAQHDICGLGKKEQIPNSSIRGNCGVLSLNLYDDGGGVMFTKVVVTSYWYLGPIYKFIWSGAWWNNDTQSGGPMGDLVIQTGYTITSDTLYYTDVGSVVGSLTYAQDKCELS
jgi:hypothetical protein